jgi:hypothetical protein
LALGGLVDLNELDDESTDDVVEPPAPDIVEPDTAEPDTAEPEVTPPNGALNWKPAFDEGDDLDGLLAARSPLLSRAFRGERG